MKTKTYLITLSLLALSGCSLMQPNPSPTASPTPPTPQETADPNLTPPPTETPELPADWESYSSESLSFSISHPPELDVETQDGAVQFVQFGPTQREGTEFYDGINLTFETGSYVAEDLQTFVQSETERFQGGPADAETSTPRTISLAGKTGYEFDVIGGLAESTQTYIPLSDTQYLHITNLTKDPENEGYPETVNRMLSTLSLTE